MTTDRTAAYLCFDPRDPAQRLADRSTWRRSDNAILISATMLYAVHGESYPICWEKVAALADLCDDPERLAAAEPPHAYATFEEASALLRALLGRAPGRRRTDLV